MAAKRAAGAFEAVLQTLGGLYGAPRALPPKTPLEWILWENVAYLVGDDRRAEAFRRLAKTVGTRAEDLARASHAKLLAVTELGGMHPEARADRLASIGDLALAHGGGGLESVLALEPKAARKVLQLFPSIGKPAADKILAACGVGRELSLDSNGLRVVLRLGYGREANSYSTSYRSALDALAPFLRADPAWLAGAGALLRQHGKTLCRRSNPDCDACPLTARCAWFRAQA